MHLKLVSNTNHILHRPADPIRIQHIRSPAFRKRVSAMTEVLRRAPGAGLAAPQVGWGVQAFLVEDLPQYMEHLPLERLAAIGRKAFPLQLFCNPVLEIVDPTPLAYFEGCLSYPGILGAVIRARGIRIKFLDQYGEERTLALTDWIARIVQHEFEHLKGKNFVSNFLPGLLMSFKEYFNNWKMASSDEILQHFRGRSFRSFAA
jgi:peptide deformylase